MIVPSLGQVPVNVDQIDFETTLPYKVVSTSSTSRLGIDVTLEKEDDPRRDEFLRNGLYEGRGGADKPENELAPIDDWPELDTIVENVDDVRLPDIPPLPPLSPPPIEDEEETSQPGVVNLVASNIGTTTATLTLTGWDKSWRYSQTLLNSSCNLVTGGNIVRLRGLEPNTEYNYSAYEPAGCDIDNTLATTTFTTDSERGSVRLIADNITTNSARLILLNWGEPWRYHNVDDTTVCAFVSGEDLTDDLASTAPLHQLEPCTEYTFVAYNARGCFPDAEIARVTFTTFGCGLEDEPTLRLTERGLVFFKAVLDNAPTSWRRELSLSSGEIVRECRLTESPNVHYTGLEPGATYILRAYSSDSCDPENELDALTVTTIDAPPALPVSLVVTNITHNSARIQIVNYNSPWILANAPSGLNPNIDRLPSITNHTSSIANVTGLIPDQTYFAQAWPRGADVPSAPRLATARYRTLATPRVAVTNIDLTVEFRRELRGGNLYLAVIRLDRIAVDNLDRIAVYSVSAQFLGRTECKRFRGTPIRSAYVTAVPSITDFTFSALSPSTLYRFSIYEGAECDSGRLLGTVVATSPPPRPDRFSSITVTASSFATRECRVALKLVAATRKESPGRVIFQDIVVAPQNGDPELVLDLPERIPLNSDPYRTFNLTLLKDVGYTIFYRRASWVFSLSNKQHFGVTRNWVPASRSPDPGITDGIGGIYYGPRVYYDQ